MTYWFPENRLIVAALPAPRPDRVMTSPGYAWIVSALDQSVPLGIVYASDAMAAETLAQPAPSHAPAHIKITSPRPATTCAISLANPLLRLQGVAIFWQLFDVSDPVDDVYRLEANAGEVKVRRMSIHRSCPFIFI